MAEPNQDFERDMLVREADWTWSEMQDFNRLVQRYRYLYIAALFASVGWSLGQAIGTKDPNAGALTNLALRPDVAGILCVVPMINVVFALLTLEAARKVQALARYRFLLAVQLGGKQPIWRWELFRRAGEEGSIRRWENPTNIAFGVLNLIVSVLCFSLASQALPEHRALWWLWSISLTFFIVSLVAIARAGWTRRNENEVAARVEVSYDDLRIRDREH